MTVVKCYFDQSVAKVSSIHFNLLNFFFASFACSSLPPLLSGRQALRALREPKRIVSQSFTKVFDFITVLIQDLNSRSSSDNTFFEEHRGI